MLRWIALAVSVVLVAVAMVAWRSDRALAELPPPPAARADADIRAAFAPEAPALAPIAPEPPPRDREARRFARYDKDRDAAVTREEYAAARRKAFAKLDVDGDGRLNFDEYATKTLAKFDAADADRSGRLDAPEFATTAIKRKPRADCPKPAREDAEA